MSFHSTESLELSEHNEGNDTSGRGEWRGKGEGDEGTVKPPIHEATLLPATVACNNVAMCMMQCCVVACCRQLLVTFRL